MDMAYEINWCDDVFPNEIDELLMLDNTDDDEDSDEFGEDEMKLMMIITMIMMIE